jgi:hypothetical protein
VAGRRSAARLREPIGFPRSPRALRVLRQGRDRRGIAGDRIRWRTKRTETNGLNIRDIHCTDFRVIFMRGP